MNALFISLLAVSHSVWNVCHHSISPHPTRDEIFKETGIARRDLEPSSNYLRLPMETGQVPQPSTVIDAILL